MRHPQKLTTFALVGGLALAGVACEVEDDDPDTVITDTEDGGTTGGAADGGEDAEAEAEAEVEVEDGEDGGETETETEG